MMPNYNLLPSILIGISTVFISSKVLAQSVDAQFNGFAYPVTSFEFVDESPATLGNDQNENDLSLNNFEAIDTRTFRTNNPLLINGDLVGVENVESSQDKPEFSGITD